MSAARSRQSRLARILAVRKAALRVSEARLAAASARAHSAEARTTQVRMLIGDASAATGQAAIAVLRGGAALRALLHPALEAARAQAREASHSKDTAARQLADAGARHDRAVRDFSAARAAAETEREDRESADRVPASSGRRK